MQVSIGANKGHAEDALPKLRTAGRLEIKSADGYVTLRQYAIEDAKMVFELIDRNREHLSNFGDKTARKYPTFESVEKHIAESLNGNVLRFGIYNDENVLVGFIKLTPNYTDGQKGEVGYYLGGEFQHNGYMRKAVQALTDYAFNTLNYNELYGEVVKGNAASENVLTKLGYVQSDTEIGYYGEGKLEDITVYTKQKHKTLP